MLWFVVAMFISQGACEQIQVGQPGPADGASRIIGGSTTTIEQYPYIVQVLYNSNMVCAGSVLTSRLVLSAGHCFVDDTGIVLRPIYYSVRAGTSYLNAGGSVRTVSEIVVHERYNTPPRDNDVAIVALASQLLYSGYVQAAYLPPQGFVLPDNVSVVLVGWGRTDANVPNLAPVLNHVTVRSINREVCASRYLWLENQTGYAYPITESMLCAGLLDVGGADACQGDSGGPVVYSGVVVGITSWGLGCAEAFFPGVNARVSSYTDWINATVSRYNTSPPVKHANSAVIFSLLASVILTRDLCYTRI